jgi:hypothetical protein
MTRVGLCALAAGGVLLATAASAQTATPDSEDGRFTFHRVDDGYLRLDGRTGRVSTCVREHAGWLCQAVPDDRAAFEAEIARLQSDNSALKKELLSHNLPLPRDARPEETVPGPQTGTGSKAESKTESNTESKTEPKPEPRTEPNRETDSATKTEPTLRLPSDAEINQMMTFLEKVWRRLVEMIMNAQKDLMRKT